MTESADWRRQVSPQEIERYRHLGWWRDRTFLDDFLDAVARHPDKTAVVSYRHGMPGPTEFTFGELGRLVDRIAGGLIALGVQRGDVITLHLPNSWEFPAMAFGAMRAGAVPNPVPHIYRERELAFTIRHSGAKVYVVDSEFRGFDYRGLGLRLKAAIPTLEHVVAIGGAPSDDVVDFAAHFVEPPRELDDQLAHELAERQPGPDDPAFLMFTSGTTGQPKAAVHTHNTAWSAGRALPDAIGLTSDDVAFMASTVGHLTGTLWGAYFPMAGGQKIVYQDVWNARQLLDIADAEGITWTLSATPFVNDLVLAQKDAPRPLSSFNTFVCGGAPIPPQTAVDAREHLDMELLSLWGMTEIGICSIHNRGAALETLAASDGMPVGHMELRIVDEDLMPVEDGMEGRLQARGPSIIVGYRGQPELTREAQTDDGWFETGDLGRRTSDGGIRLTGRSKDIIIRGGQNVPVVEIENCLLGHGMVREVAVVAYPDDRLGERGCAVVVPEGATPTLDDLTRHLEAEGFAKQFWPERIEIVEALPRTPAGKVQKFVLRAQIATSA